MGGGVYIKGGENEGQEPPNLTLSKRYDPGALGDSKHRGVGGEGRQEDMFCRAARGHKGDVLRDGIWTVTNCDCF